MKMQSNKIEITQTTSQEKYLPFQNEIAEVMNKYAESKELNGIEMIGLLEALLFKFKQKSIKHWDEVVNNGQS